MTSRRDFLKTVGVAGGAGVMYGTMGALGLAPAAADTPDFTPPSTTPLSGRARKSVVVLGAGIAGLTAAYELGKAGYAVTVLEARNRPGGRSWTVRGGTTETDLKGRTQTARFSRGEYMNAGPGRLPQHHVTLDYCRELGVKLEPFVNQNAEAYLFRKGEHGLSGKAVKHRAAKADVYGYVSEMLAQATDQGALDQKLSSADKEALLSFLRSFGAIGAKVQGDPAGSYRYTGTGRRGYVADDEPGYGLQAGTPLAPYSVEDVLRSGIGNYFSFELGWDQAMMMFQPVGGMDRIAYAFEDAVGKEKIRYGAEVTALRNTANGVEVVYKEAGRRARTVTADFAVCSLPPHLAARLSTNLPAPILSALKAVSISDAGKIGIEYDRRWWEEEHRIYGGITNSNTEIGNLWYPSHGFQGKRGTLIGYYNTGASARTYGALSPSARLAKALEQGAEIHGPAYTQGVKAAFSVNWTDVRYSEGAWVSWPGGQGPGTDYAKLLEPAGNVYFAGDHLSHAIAWQHGAMVAARAAVSAIHARVKA